VSAPPKAVQRELRDIVRTLEAVRFRLIGVEATLPPSPAETDRLQDVDKEETDPVTELRSVIQCVLKDSLQPLIGDLRDATALVILEPEEEDG
jgi:hypothetical protein